MREAKAALETIPTQDHEPAGLLRSSNGAVLVGYENATLYLQSAKEWEGVLGLNEFTGGVEIRKAPPPPITTEPGAEITDVFDTEITRWLERRSHLMFRTELVHRVADGIADRNRFHPPRDYLESLPHWDGVERISTWLFAYCGVDPGSDTKPNHYAATVGRKFLISMIARVMRPGCKADHMLVLEGKTGSGKSSLARALVPCHEWFTDQVGDLGSKDASMAIRGVWIVELGELDALSRADERTAKRFISEQFQYLRLPYGRRVQRFERQCVFIGTTERSDWMRSETGRRFWPVLCRTIDFQGVARDRNLLLSEALHAFRAGESWHLAGSEEIEEATTEQRKRYSEDIWRDKVLEIAVELAFENWVPVSRIIEKLGVPVSQQNDQTSRRIGAILRFEGWTRKQRRVSSGARAWGYEEPE